MRITQQILVTNPGVGTIVRKTGPLLAAFLLCVFPLVCLPAINIEPYPGAEVVKSTRDEKVVSRRIILGPLKKINNILEPKFFEYVTGTRSSTIYYIPDARRVGRIVEFYRDQFDQSAQVLFRCEGRNCGSSNYWANTIFKSPILYGPEQYQNYIIAKDLATNAYISIYVGQRGTKKIYVHVQITDGAETSSAFTKGSLSAALKTRGRYVITTEDFILKSSLIAEIADFMKVNRQSKLTLVSHDSLQKGEFVEDGLKRTLRLSDSVRSTLVAAGISKDRLQAFGVGPLSPLDAGHNSRLELLVIRRTDD